MKLYARASSAKGSFLYGMPGGRATHHRVPYGGMLLIAGNRVRCRWDGNVYFPVQFGSEILWASEAGFSIMRA